MLLPPLTCGRIVNRYKRFLADVILDDGRCITAHCPNTGTMSTCWAPGAPVQLTHSDKPTRKLAWTLERVDMGAGWVGVHTGRVNGVVAEAITAGQIPLLNGYSKLQREVTIDMPNLPRGRIDLGLYNGSVPDALVEIKNVTLFDPPCLRFPDAVTARGLKHLELLLAIRHNGLRAVLLLVLNRPEGDFFAPARAIDPVYAQRLTVVAAAGVEIMAIRLHHGTQSLDAGAPVAVNLDY